ncbi:MAG: diguanylate cyclase [Oscillospiraceae bacterium]|nr:diguanylate cyclase [Oscillospiraceae bacterium]
MSESLHFDTFMACPIPFSIHRFEEKDDSGQNLIKTVSYNDAFKKAFIGDETVEPPFRNGTDILNKLLCGSVTADALIAEMERVYLGGKKLYSEYDFECSGTYYRAKLFRIDVSDIGVLYDEISREKKLMLDIDAFLSVNIDLLCVLTPEARFVKVNYEFERMLGYKKSELESESLFSFLHPGDISSTHSMINQLSGDVDIPFFSNRFRGKDSVYRKLQWRAELHHDMIFAAARDITETTALTEKLQDSASRDSMTGLFSRLAFDIQAADVIRKFKRRFFPVSLMIINLDRFKKVNDKWGHPVGDQVLKHVADILKDNLRQTDFPARYSGEEFVVILLDTPENGALFAAEKVRRKLELNPHKIAGKITVSIGVAALERDEAFEEWFMRADTALYLAKNMGRNQIVGSAESRGRDIKAIKYEWNKDWASGNAKIDEQHRALLEAGNRLIETHENCQRIEEQKAINELMIDLDQHFRSEEFVLKQHGYERLKEHSAIHESLRKQMRFWRDLRNQQRVNPTAFYSFLLEKVVIDHMITDDSKFFYLFK